eukprot:CAMPEP_0203667078 /NCGR_PEP_ID=MMETSP0090-20130426/3985_1 /ASSEMBLY_ACC=CAM_ASM_001088 /TAXON_ID=426623 /ORGANISM="Chaetoceros affinis, Strain CCMP159" /LENGTH=45 /DNA_ID= /DNA_START= /DNA_END= /DNA_ORIENTATION=
MDLDNIFSVSSSFSKCINVGGEDEDDVAPTPAPAQPAPKLRLMLG